MAAVNAPNRLDGLSTTASMGCLYDVFLCHNQADKPAVEELAQRLRDQALEPWLDKSNLLRGEHWIDEAQKCLSETCASCAVIVGPSGLGPWQMRELQLALDRHIEAQRNHARFPVIPVLLPGGNANSIPPFLKGHTWVSFPTTLDDEELVDELARAIRGLPPRAAPRADVECPYRGLQFFDVAHAECFFGREQLTARLVEKLKPNRRFLAIVGASGSGKSSLARAGLVAALKQGAIEGSDHWPVLICRPGSDPCANLAVELAKSGSLGPDKQAAKDHLKARMREDRKALHESVQLTLPSGSPELRFVILVDQFEELFTLCQEEALRQAFADNLVYASQVAGGQTLVLAAMRADFYGKCALYPDLARAVSECQELIGPMTPDNLREAIEKPAQMVGCELERGLVEQLLNDVANEPGSLPFLQFALKELWNKRTGRRLTTEAYRTIGGVTGALRRKADEVYAGLSDSQQQICRRIFLRLTQPGEGTEDTKRRVSMSELRPAASSQAEVQAVLLDLSEAETRLVTGEAEGGEEFFEVAHEALIRGWPQLRTWIDADRAALLTQRRLTEAARLWKEHRRDASFLYAGARLTAAREWAATHSDEINPLESDFVKASRRHARRQRLQVVAGLAALVLLVTAGWLRIRAQNIEQDHATRAAGLVRQLLAAEISQVPGIVRELEPYRNWADPLLRNEEAHAAPGSSQKLRLDLALLPVDGTRLPGLRDRLQHVSPAEFFVVRDFLSRDTEPDIFDGTVVQPLWNKALAAADVDSKQDQERFQAACAMASYAPADPRWSQIAAFVCGHLVSLEASPLVAWREALRPAKAQLIKPLALIFRDANRKEQSRTYATETLAEYAGDRPPELFDLLADSELFQFSALFNALAAHKDVAIALAQQELSRKATQNASEDQKEGLARRQANAAVALLRLGVPEKVWPLFEPAPDPRTRSYVIHWLGPLGGDPQSIQQQLRFNPGPSTGGPTAASRPALLLALGQFNEAQLSASGRQALLDKLLDAYETEPNPALHGAVEWLLRKWGQAGRLQAVVEKLKSNEKQLQARKSTDARRWYVNTQGQTFTIVDAGVFLMGSPESEPDRSPIETPHLCRIGRRYAISTHEVTKAQFGRFQQERPDVAKVDTSQWVKTDDSAQVEITWYDAAAYCNWLSEREGLAREQWCYEPNRQGAYGAGMKARPNHLKLTGYRLPTEAEWEYACRAGTLTSRYYGLTERLLPQYAWYPANGHNRTWPVGSLEPNDLGLFDMLGNALEWCFDAYGPYPTEANKISDDMPATQPVEVGDRHLLRGAAFDYQPVYVRSAQRSVFQADDRKLNFGFRPARTCP